MRATSPSFMAGRGRGRFGRAVASHLGSADATRVIYGAVIGLALVVALEAHPPTAGEAVAAIVGTAVAVGLAETYSQLVGREAQTRRPIGRVELRAAAREAVAVMLGAGFPAVFFVLSAAGLFEVGTAFEVSKWTGLGVLCAYGYLAGRLSGSGAGRALVHAVAVGAIGGILIVLKALLH